MGSPNREDAVAYRAVINLLDGKPVNWREFDDRTGSYQYPHQPGSSGNIWDLVNSARLSHPSAVERKRALNVYEESYDEELYGGDWWLNEPGSRAYAGYRLPAQLLAYETFGKMVAQGNATARTLLPKSVLWWEKHLTHIILAAYQTRTSIRTAWTGMRSGGSGMSPCSNDLAASIAMGKGVKGFSRYHYKKSNTGRVLYSRTPTLLRLGRKGVEARRNAPGGDLPGDLFPKTRVPYTFVLGGKGALMACDRNINGNTAPVLVSWSTHNGWDCFPPGTATGSRKGFVHSEVSFSHDYSSVTLTDARFTGAFRANLVALLGERRVIYRREPQGLISEVVESRASGLDEPIFQGSADLPKRRSLLEELAEKLQDWWAGDGDDASGN